MSRKVDFIFVIEHHRRELTFVREICRNLSLRGYSTCIISEYFSIWRLLLYKDAVVLLPHCISIDSNILRSISNKRGYKIVNMNWEQMLSPVSKSVKRLKDDANQIYQMAWNKDFTEFLLNDCGVHPYKIVKSLNPTRYVLTNAVKSKSFETFLIEKDISEYIFIPLNYNWAMMSSDRISKRIQKLGYNENEAREYIEFSESHQEKFFIFLKSLLLKDSRVVVLRPHPSITVGSYIQKMMKIEGLRTAINSKQMIVSDDFTAIDWINSAEVTISNWSSLIYDAHESGKKAGYFWPYNLPSLIDAEYTKSPQKFSNLNEFYGLRAMNPKSSVKTEFQILIDGLIKIKMEDNVLMPDWEFSIKPVIIAFSRFGLKALGFNKLIPPRIRIEYFKPLIYDAYSYIDRE